MMQSSVCWFSFLPLVCRPKSMGCFCGTHEKQRKTRPRPCLNPLCSCLSAQAAKHIQRPQTKIGGKPQSTGLKAGENIPFLEALKNRKEEPICKMAPFPPQGWRGGLSLSDLIHVHRQEGYLEAAPRGWSAIPNSVRAGCVSDLAHG